MLSMCTASKYFVMNSLLNPSFSPFANALFQNFIPAIGLKNGDVIFFFILADFFCHSSYADSISASIHHPDD